MCGVPLGERCHSGVAVDRSTRVGQVAQRMRILHLAKYYWPRSGGMERVVQDLAEGAAALGHEVSVVAVESRVGGRVGGQQSTITRVFSFGALGSEEIAPGYLAAARRRADILHLHHPHPLADMACLLRRRRSLSPNTTTVFSPAHASWLAP